MKDLSARSYVPYSLQPEYCFAEDTHGQLHAGVRTENISYPLSISRIQAALFSCLAAGRTPRRLLFPEPPSVKEELILYWQTEYDLEPLEVSTDLSGEIFDPAVPASAEHGHTMYKRLVALCERAVTPNSDFQVSAFLEVTGGSALMPGVNVECSNWQLGLCAERVAISRAVSMGYDRREFGNLYVIAPKSDYASPCGACRQVISEHLPANRIFLYQNEDKCLSVTNNELLPYHFGGEILRKKAE